MEKTPRTGVCSQTKVVAVATEVKEDQSAKVNSQSQKATAEPKLEQERRQSMLDAIKCRIAMSKRRRNVEIRTEREYKGVMMNRLKNLHCINSSARLE